MEEELARYRCQGDDGAFLTVIEYRHVDVVCAATGARRLGLSTGEPVRYIDAETFEVIASGELLRREP
jgi:hypothetical protein